MVIYYSICAALLLVAIATCVAVCNDSMCLKTDLKYDSNEWFTTGVKFWRLSLKSQLKSERNPRSKISTIHFSNFLL